ncbi:MAG: ABC transporter substrate-binding protein [Pseudomonadota bacterium]
MLLQRVRFNLAGYGLRYISIGIILVLSGCSESFEQLSKSRIAYSSQQDEIASCRIYALSDSFATNNVMCDAFLATDSDCHFFPDKHQKCKPFLGDKNYSTQKYHCQSHENIVNYCQETYEQNSWYSRILKYRDNTLLQQLFLYAGIDLQKQWYQSNAYLYDEFYLDIAVIGADVNNTATHNGAQLAADLLNGQGKKAGRKIRLILEAVENAGDSSLVLSNKIYNMKSVVAAIDGQQSQNNKLIAQLYEKAGMVHLITAASSVNVLRENMKLNFRLIPNNAMLAEETAKFFAEQAYQKVAVLTGLNDSSREQARAFYEKAVKHGINVVYSKNFFQRRNDFADIISKMAAQKIDAVYLATDWPESVAEIMTQTQVMGYAFKFIGSQFINASSVKTNGLIIPSVFNPMAKSKESEKFVRLYQKKYGVQPGLQASLAYDAVNLIARNVHRTGSSLSFELASSLRYMTDWTGANGLYQFNQRGELTNHKIVFKELQQGVFKVLDRTKFRLQQTKVLLNESLQNSIGK